jgi:DNA-binding HxlR family transcriptional regulator
VSTFSPPNTVHVSSVDAQRVEAALSVMAPKWTTWVAQALTAQKDPMRVRDLAARIPVVSDQLLSKRLHQMHADGLVTRADHRFAAYQLTSQGRALSQVHKRLADWSRTHLAAAPIARATRIEDALRRLCLRHTTTVVQVLVDGPRPFGQLAEQAGLDPNQIFHRLLKLQADGLVTRADNHHGAPYALTAAGAALGPVYAAVERWNNPTTAPPASAAQIRKAPRDDPDDARATAALGRSPAAFSGLFSHAPQPQPPVPASVTARSAPTRAR